ncbi:DUF2270 domain-containing protein [Bradyrhizobium neotropicale]|uniref:DUF2270 domain-containing protein n=1 Tax=Bradyrhizobium neotropicale TaxID=1497615 RepID=UPI001AD60936|nr:DUF2270 domain-containing protein [Bradyrhizobium neotropicale]MBO4225667.1 DUF2270 domain-containing protein [Bradyrhizobium neotropicale]
MALPEPREPTPLPAPRLEFTAAEIGALAHLYRGEVYRSTVWRTRLDSSTNWAVVTTGIALSATYSSADASPLPMVLVGLLVTVFLLFEARRYRYFNVWRARARLLETDFYAPMIRGERLDPNSTWTELLANDYRNPSYHISYARAVGRRLRRTYGWIFAIQAIAYYGKLAIHPVPLTSLAEVWERAAIGPIPGILVVLAGVLFHTSWAIFALVTHHIETTSRRERQSLIAMG